MKDFAKLYNLDDIGQVLVVLETDDNGYPVVTFRIPDLEDFEFSQSMGISSDDENANEKFARNIFDAVNETNIRESLVHLIKTRDALSAGDTE